MARPESVAVGGYYATPLTLLSSLAALLRVKGRPESAEDYERFAVWVLDPCAADGVAMISIGSTLKGEKIEPTYYSIEVEKTRHQSLKENISAETKEWRSSERALQGDAFRVTFEVKENGGVDFLFLNPPYDFDAIYNRLEEKFLRRFTETLKEQGVLMFLVPYTALAASAETLAKHYTNLHCFRFPLPEWGNYKQVALIATKSTTLLEPDPAIVALVNGWASDAETIPELPTNGPAVVEVPISASVRTEALDGWTLKPVDVKALLEKVQPWRQSDRSGKTNPVSGIFPDTAIEELLLRKYPIATPPRPAHIAAGIASGIFNGSRVEPNDATSGLPSLLVKGVFDREYRTIEEKLDKDGEVKGYVQIQQPKLVTTVLDLTTHQYHTLKTGTTTSESRQTSFGWSTTVTVDQMTTSDLLTYYGQSLMTVMEEHCPILYDPRKDADQIPLPEFERTPFTAQAHAIRALVRLLGGPGASKAARRGKAAILLGEIGSGKSTVSVMAARTVGCGRILILCPPHLLKSWSNEIAAILPEADVRILQSVTDVDDIQNTPAGRPVVAILSRESAKLGHAWEGISGACPGCGMALSVTASEAAKKRLYCGAAKFLPVGPLAHHTMNLGRALLPYAAKDHRVQTLLRNRHDLNRIDHHTKNPKEGLPSWGSDENLNPLFDTLIDAYAKGEGVSEKVKRALLQTLFAFYTPERAFYVVDRLLSIGKDEYSPAKALGRDLLLFLPPQSEGQKTLHEKYPPGTYSYSPFPSRVRSIVDGHPLNYDCTIRWVNGGWVEGKEGEVITAGSKEAVLKALGALTAISSWGKSKACPEPLYQAIPEPRRIPLARYISKRHPSLFDFLIVDEGHEYATDGSAQERSAHRLTGLGLPTILMTGSIMNGYAESLFINMWSISEDFRKEFGRDEKTRFIDRFGYRKRLVEDKDPETGKVISYGSVTDRVERTERVLGNAPGVLPLFLLKHLLPISVTLHKADLAIDLPPCVQSRTIVDTTKDLFSRYKEIETALVQQIKKDQFDEELAGRLWGQLAELPSYLDRATADVGNGHDGFYEIRYPESCGGGLVHRVELFPASTILPKEEWMLDKVETELAAGRNVMVFAWHVALLPRLARLIKDRIGEAVPILHADKVPTGKRQDWIDREVVKKGRRVLVTNPVAIQTGLNNLVHFASEIWMENPACNPTTYRQAIGRVDRIGQRLMTQILFPLYGDSLQVTLHDLLLRKVAVAVSTDGLDPESSMAAAGVVEDEYLTGLSIGKQIYAMYQEGIIPEPKAPPRLRPAPKPAKWEERNVMDFLSDLADTV